MPILLKEKKERKKDRVAKDHTCSVWHRSGLGIQLFIYYFSPTFEFILVLVLTRGISKNTLM